MSPQKLLQEMRDRHLRSRRFFARANFARLDFVVIAMGFISIVTTLTGIVYALPTDTFSLSKSFIFLRDHGGEEFWAVIVLVFGTLGAVCTYLEYYRHHFLVFYGERPPRYYQPDRTLGRWVWFSISLLWGFVGCSFLVNVPVSPGAAIYVPLGILSFIVSIHARDRRDNGD
jgi:hypothetical protein